MADPTYLSGKHGYVVAEDFTNETRTEYPFADWDLTWVTDFLKRNTFMSGGKQNGIPGFQRAELNLNGPLALGLTALTGGQTLTFYLGVSDDDLIDFQVSGILSSVGLSNKAEDGPMIKVKLDSVGDFDIATV